jgi:hypothetical protein
MKTSSQVQFGDLRLHCCNLLLPFTLGTTIHHQGWAGPMEEANHWIAQRENLKARQPWFHMALHVYMVFLMLFHHPKISFP